MAFLSNSFSFLILDLTEKPSDNLNNAMFFFQNYKCLGTFFTENDAINCILENRPQIVFIKTAREISNRSNTFSIINELRLYIEKIPEFIVVSENTAHSYQAIKNGAHDYLLHPIKEIELRKTLLKFEKKQTPIEVICIKSFTEHRFVVINDILYLKADNNTTDYFLKNGTTQTAFQTIKLCKEELPNNFVRVHKSYVINIKYLTKIHFSKLQCSVEHSNVLIPFSKHLRDKMTEIKNFILFGNNFRTNSVLS